MALGQAFWRLCWVGNDFENPEIVTMWSVCGGQCHDQLNKFSKYEIDASHTGTAQNKCQVDPPTLDKTLNFDTEPAFALASTPSSFCVPRIIDYRTDRQAAPTEPNERIETQDAYDPYALCVAMQQSTTMQSVPSAVAQEQRMVVWTLAKIAG